MQRDLISTNPEVRDATLRELHHLSITDGLTGLYNARHFMHHIREEVSRAACSRARSEPCLHFRSGR